MEQRYVEDVPNSKRAITDRQRQNVTWHFLFVNEINGAARYNEKRFCSDKTVGPIFRS